MTTTVIAAGITSKTIISVSDANVVDAMNSAVNMMRNDSRFPLIIESNLLEDPTLTETVLALESSGIDRSASVVALVAKYLGLSGVDATDTLYAWRLEPDEFFDPNTCAPDYVGTVWSFQCRYYYVEVH